jgi:hypothetical protein
MHHSLVRTSFAHIVFLAGIFAVDPAAAAGAPAAALNKTVTLSWSTSGTARRADGTPVSFSNLNTRVIYISSTGRTFLRMQVRGGRAGRPAGGGGPTRQAELGPGESYPRGGNVSLQGNKLVGVEAFASGARQFVATFDDAFSSCSLSVIDAKAGNAKIRRKGPDGAMYELDSVSTGSPTCSIQSGNAFSH